MRLRSDDITSRIASAMSKAGLLSHWIWSPSQAAMMIRAGSSGRTSAATVPSSWPRRISSAYESAMALSVTYGSPVGKLVDHVDDLLHRFANRALGDTVERVARDPQRKMEPGDRVLGALGLALAAGTPSAHLAVVVALGAVAWERSADLSPGQVDAHVAAALAGHDAALDDVRRHLAALRSGAGSAEMVRLLGARFDPPVIP